ncbi:MAG: PhnD/SsuA/transferrin family substrate-binding protein [Dehalococcoidia bacterium]|nr:PhnD/SsuA/transferrin family substrate-binding protein [Dehalococcoidia bacterium]
MGPVTDGLYPVLASRLEALMGTPVRCMADIPWEDRMAALDAGEVHLGHICGTQYLPRSAAVEPLVAPVPLGERHGGQPVDFADIVVAADAPFASFEDLAGSRWAYTEPTSHSGFGAVAHALAARGVTWDFFGEVVETGSHDAALQLIARGAVDGAAIDATMLPLSLAAGVVPPGSVRVLASLGPSPGPADRVPPRRTRGRSSAYPRSPGHLRRIIGRRYGPPRCRYGAPGPRRRRLVRRTA